MNRRCISGPSLLLGLSVLALACGPTPDADGGLDLDSGPPLACESAADCDDGLYCTGEETCVESRCVRGAPVLCDDGVACTIDRCDDVRRACLSTPPDVDGDGAGSAACLALDGVPLGTDCDDSDPRRFVGNIERCDVAGVDEDCDPSTFGAEDLDGDRSLSSRCCNGEECGPDCDDTRAGVGPGAPEICNGLDEDCDGVIDEEATMSGFPDLDADGWGDDSAGPIAGCMGQVRFSVRPGDCDDSNPNVHPELPELCDSVDNDCDSAIDEMAEAARWYTDADGDGYGTAIGPQRFQCEPPAGFSLLATDCDDADPNVSPAAEEACNGIDDDCNGLLDFQIGVNDHEDDDGDGVIDAACDAPGARDCDDDDPRTSNEAFELCDGRDNDCDDAIDEGAASGVWFPDRDSDGYGDASGAAMVSCMPIPGYVPRSGDCDDRDPTRSPGGRDVCNGADDDCDGTADNGPAASCGGGSQCIDGRCQLICPVGRADCDGDPANGCEVDTTSSVSDCGVCGNSCGTAGACSVSSCDAVAQIALGERFTCVRRTQGGVACWGDNTFGQLGAPTPEMSAQPLEVSLPFDGAIDLVAGRAHACAVSNEGLVYCWGANAQGQLGRGSFTPSGMPAPVSGLGIVSEDLAAGADHTCVVLSSTVRCWGRGDEGQLGNGANTNVASPVTVGGLPNSPSLLAVGGAFTCVRDTLSTLYCWGRGAERQLANGGASSNTPTLVSIGQSVSSVAAGGTHACARDFESRTHCWGGNAFGQARPSSAGTNVGAPTVFVGLSFGRLSLLRGHTVFRDSLGRITGFGANGGGQLGDGTTMDRLSFTRPLGDPSSSTLGVGATADHTCARFDDEAVYCWGDNSRGQLGVGAASVDPTVPQQVLRL